MKSVLAEYLAEIAAVHATGAHVAETSFYPALANLLNAIGAGLSPKVRCVINLRNSGGGIPDGGLFTAEQLRRQDPRCRRRQAGQRGAGWKHRGAMIAL